MAAHNMKGSLRRRIQERNFYTAEGKAITPMRPGKTAEDHRIGAWCSKQERNAKQAMYRGE